MILSQDTRKGQDMRYKVTVVFDTDEPLTPIQLDTLEYSAVLVATEPVDDDGESADWSGALVSVDVTKG